MPGRIGVVGVGVGWSSRGRVGWGSRGRLGWGSRGRVGWVVGAGWVGYTSLLSPCAPPENYPQRHLSLMIYD